MGQLKLELKALLKQGLQPGLLLQAQMLPIQGRLGLSTAQH
jgi:hypothetical protein